MKRIEVDGPGGVSGWELTRGENTVAHFGHLKHGWLGVGDAAGLGEGLGDAVLACSIHGQNYT